MAGIPGAFNEMAAGPKVYGAGRYFPTSGLVDKIGYRERDLQAKARKNAILKRMQAQQKGSYMSSEYLGGIS